MRTCSLITAGEKLSEGLARSTFPATCRRDWPRGTNDSYVRLGLPPGERGWHGKGLTGYRGSHRLFAPRSVRVAPSRSGRGRQHFGTAKSCPDTLCCWLDRADRVYAA